ncbi:MAG: TlpA family protein disulfide reductase [Bacteroides sp.]|nr:TlpA family protein disulfide reductase [Bacteroides sp.]
MENAYFWANQKEFVMKRIAFLLAGVLSYLCPSAQERSVEQPVYLARNNSVIEVARIDGFQPLENGQKKNYRVNQVGQVSNEELLSSILARYEGKTILVDFWATWCAPCRRANAEMAPMKKELDGKDIVYVYITGETSPQETWSNMIPDIHGEHYRLTNAQWNYLGKAYGIRGVPTYFIVSPQGEITYKSIGFPGAAKMKEELEKALSIKP